MAKPVSADGSDRFENLKGPQMGFRGVDQKAEVKSRTLLELGGCSVNRIEIQGVSWSRSCQKFCFLKESARG